VTRAALALLILSPLAARAADIPFGHADWKPSPTDPVGFAGQGGNWYPGASPPTEWWEGTPTVAKGKIGAPSHTFTYGQYPRQADLKGYADNRSKNIRWKVPTPGWSDSLPVVVSNRVISLASPHHVTCYDADTGKVLWHDELRLLTLPVLTPDRKSVGPAPDPARAAKEQDLFERALAYVRVRIGATAVRRDLPVVGPDDWAPRAPLLKHAIGVLEKWKDELKADYPDIGPTLDAELSLLRDCLEGKEEDDRDAPKGAKTQRLQHYAGKAPRVLATAPDLQAYAMKKLGLLGGHFSNDWQGVLSEAAATPVSDGEVVCVMFGHGQIAAYEVATGKRLWAWRDPLMNAGSASHLPSPLLWKDNLIFMSAGKDPAATNKKKGAYSTAVMAVDKRTGKVKWEVPGGPGGSWWGDTHGDHMSPCLVRLPDGKGGVRAAVVSNKGGVLDAETGEALAQLPDAAADSYGVWRSGFLAAAGGRVFRNSAGDNYHPPVSAWPLKFTGDKLAVDPGFVCQVKGEQDSFVLTDKIAVLGSAVIDATTGKKLAELPGRQRGAPTLAGNLLIITENEAAEVRMREDRLALGAFTVYDLSDPARPRLVSSKNLLGTADMPADIADKYFPEFRKPDSKLHALGTYRGLGAYFGARTSGVTAHGSRLYVQSQTHLYCIGEK